MTGPTRLDHALWCQSCGFLGRKRRRREREANDRLLVNFHHHLAAQMRAERRQKWIDSLPDDTPPWQVHLLESFAHDMSMYFPWTEGRSGVIANMPRQW